MADVEIDYAMLNQLAGSVKQIAVELDEADRDAEALAVAVDLPFPDRSDLADAARAFATDWDYARSMFAVTVMTLAQRFDEVGAAWAGWDAGAHADGATTMAPGSYAQATR